MIYFILVSFESNRVYIVFSTYRLKSDKKWYKEFDLFDRVLSKLDNKKIYKIKES